MRRFTVLALISILFSFDTKANVTKVYGNGFLEINKDLPTLHLKGSEYEMGKQYGYLAGDRVAANIENLKSIGDAQSPQIKILPNFIFTWLRKTVGWIFWQTFSKDVKTHIEGMVDGAREAGVKLLKYDVAFVNSVIDIVGIAKSNEGELPLHAVTKSEKSFLLKVLGLGWMNTNCDSMAVWGSRTVDGKTFQTRNTDLQTGMGIERYPLVIIYKPHGKIPFVTASFSGMVGVFTGMNAYGVALGQVWAFSKDVMLAEPWQLSVRKIFSEVKTAKEALEQFKKMRTTTYGNNFVIADAGEHNRPDETGYSIEMTSKRFAYFTQNDPKELEVKYNGVSYGLPLSEGVFRGDVSFDPAIRSRQVSGNGPTGDPVSSESYTNRYKGQYDRIINFEHQGILIQKEQAESISRETAMPGSSLQTAVYANTDRDMWVSFSKILEDGSVIEANQQEYQNIPFKDYLTDLEVVDGKLQIKNWLNSRSDLRLKILSKNKIIESDLDLQKRSLKRMNLNVSEGDIIELYSQNKLIDRLVQ